MTNDPQLLKYLSDGQYEYVDVTFQAANTETVIPYTILTPEDPESVRWLDITQGAVNVGGTDTPAYVYRSALPSRKAWGTGYIVLKATVAGYVTRLKLFVERT
jgi:hypothetical protein